MATWPMGHYNSRRYTSGHVSTRKTSVNGIISDAALLEEINVAA
jgi:hypothetical protein